MTTLILASASPRRRQLLQEAGLAFIVRASNTEEVILPEESSDAYALRIAREKAQEVARHCAGDWILGADTIVEIDDHILGKPRDLEDGVRMLRLLSGRTHQVKTAFAILDAAGHVRAQQIVTSRVTFKALSDAQIHEYLATGEPFDKAGAYAVQGIGAALVDSVEGSYTNVVGLPVAEVLVALRALDALPTEKDLSA